MNTKEYNGWTNYETWAVKLWMDNSEGVQDAWIQTASMWLAVDSKSVYASQTREERATYQLSEQIKEEHEAMNPLAETCNVFTDLMNAALSEVNWYEIAEHFIEAAQERLAHS